MINRRGLACLSLLLMLAIMAGAALAAGAPMAAARHPLTLTADSATKVYDGDPLTAPTVRYDAAQLLPGHTVEATVSGAITVCGTVPNVIMAWTVRDAQGADVSSAYDVIREDGALTVTPARFSLILSAVGAEKLYDGLPLVNHNFTYTLSQLRPGHTIRATVEGSVTLPGWDYSIVTDWVIHDAYGRDVTENYKVATRKGVLRVHRASHPLTLTAASASKTFDGLPLTDGGYAYDLAGLMPGDRLEATVAGSAVYPGDTPNAITAWRVVREDGTDASDNYAVTLVPGTLTIHPATLPLTLTASSAEMAYDGTPLTSADYTWSPALAEGTRVEATVEGTITHIGQTANRIVSWRILDAQGMEVTENYAATCIDGTLTVTPASLPLTLTAASAEKAYDGTPLMSDGFTFDAAALPAGCRVEATVSGQVTTPGSTANQILDYAIYDPNGVDITANYAVTCLDGTLTVTPGSQPLTLTAASDSKPYDGVPLTNAAFTYDPDRLLAGDTLTAAMEGTITDAGQSPNRVVSVTVRSQEGVDVTDCYAITTVEGTLTIAYAGIPLTLTAASAEKAYDGLPLLAMDYAYDADALLPGHVLTATVEGAQTEAGSAPSTVTAWRVVDAAGTDMSLHYDVTLSPGTLTVHAAQAPAPEAAATAEARPGATPEAAPVSTMAAAPDACTVTYHSNFPTGSGLENAAYTDPRLYAPGDVLPFPAPQTLGWAVDGMAFQGWMDNPAADTPLTAAIMGAEDRHLYARWGEGYLLTIRHVDADNEYPLVADALLPLAEGDSYSYAPLQISGYTATGAHRSTDAPDARLTAEGEGVMPAQSLVITILYTRATKGPGR